eukprot:RCo022315
MSLPRNRGHLSPVRGRQHGGVISTESTDQTPEKPRASRTLQQEVAQLVFPQSKPSSGVAKKKPQAPRKRPPPVPTPSESLPDGWTAELLGRLWEVRLRFDRRLPGYWDSVASEMGKPRDECLAAAEATFCSPKKRPCARPRRSEEAQPLSRGRSAAKPRAQRLKEIARLCALDQEKHVDDLFAKNGLLGVPSPL